MRKIASILMVMLVLGTVLSACTAKKEVPIGTYVSDGDLAEVIVQNDNKVMILGPLQISAAFEGTYVVKGSKLILTIAEQEEYVFLIEDNKLIFEKGKWLENWLEQGAVLYLLEK